ncbi:MAG TPA: outer membrane beta-barrel protein, partial [Pyrinomonadaceae bacterium]|nr:outer membrane beta-barrel protein [Pyrinomonadaceae bacterium]
MQKHFPRVLVLLLTLCFTAAKHTNAQQANNKEPAKIEAGIHFSSFTLGPQDQQLLGFEDHARSEAGAGARVGYNITKYLAVEAEINFFPNENAPTFVSGGNLLQGQFGAKVGKRFDRFGIFAKGRPGFLNFSRVITQTGTQSFNVGGQTITFPTFGIERRNYFSLDVGGVVEFYPSRRVLVRFDAGDTIVHQGDNPLASLNLNTQQARFAHKFQFSSGIAFRFLNPESPDDVDSSQSTGERKFEIGAQFSSLGIREFEYSLNPAMPNATVYIGTNNQQGLGGRLTYHFVPSFGVEVQGDFYPG